MFERASTVSLIRGESRLVGNLLSAMGGLKETRLSAILGYLIHLCPDVAEDLFGISQPIESISLEPRSENGKDRYDVVVSNARGSHIIEVKIDGHTSSQLKRYRKANRRLYTIGARLRSHAVEKIEGKYFASWQQLVHVLERKKRKGRRADPYFNGLVDDLVDHLREHLMVKGTFEDVYIRDLSGESVEIYFNQGLYKFQPKFFDKAKNARYFAPYLTMSNSRGERESVFSALGVGISYLSKVVERYLVSESDLVDLLKKHKYTRKDIDFIYNTFKWKKTSKRQHGVLLLEKPMRIFQRPVTKTDLWGEGSTGAMPSMFLDFGELIAASNGLFPRRKKKGNAQVKRKKARK